MKKILPALFCLFAAPLWAQSYLIDVRSDAEFSEAHAQGALHLPLDNIAEIARITADKDAEIHLYCRSGRRADIAAQALRDMGYKNVRNLGTLADAQAFAAE